MSPQPMITYARRFAIAVTLVTASFSACAGEPDNVTAGEIALLPKYCADKNWSGSREGSVERRAYWAQLMGPSWAGLHHYCWGLVNVRRATYIVDRTRKNYLLEVAISDYIYAIENSTSDFVLLPELWYKLGEAQIARGMQASAVESLDRSIKLKADYWPAYLLLIRTHEKLHMVAEARNVIKNGLAVDSTQAALLEESARLDKAPAPGKPPRLDSGKKSNSKSAH